MTDDLIRRQDAIDALEREKTYCRAFRDGYAPINVFEKYNAGLADGIKALKALPTAERKKGKWKSFYHGGTNITFQCSVCGIGGSQSRTNFCPNCGARMEEDT